MSLKVIATDKVRRYPQVTGLALVMVAFGVSGLISLASSRALTPLPVGVAGTWTMAWNDEFDGTQLNTVNWSPGEPWDLQQAAGQGYYNKDDAAFVIDSTTKLPPLANLQVSEGSLKLKASRLNPPAASGKSITSALITTRAKQAAFTHGFYEARVKIPAGADLWPAFWMLGNNQWPATGELDIFEFVNNGSSNGIPFFTVHWSGPCNLWNHCQKTQSSPWPAKITDLEGRYVTFGMQRTSTDIKIYIDGQYKYGFSNTTQNEQGQTLPSLLFNDPMHIRFDLQVGGGWADNTSLAAQEGTFEIDYVRAWKASTASTDTTPPTVSLTAPANGSGAAVGSTVTVNASASDNIGVSKVDFYVDGTYKATDSTAPYSYGWNTAGQAVGTKALSATAYDAAGNRTASTVISLNLAAVTKTGDINSDNRVNAIDLSVLLARDGQNYPAADFNKDGIVGAADLSMLLANWTW